MTVQVLGPKALFTPSFLMRDEMERFDIAGVFDSAPGRINYYDRREHVHCKCCGATEVEGWQGPDYDDAYCDKCTDLAWTRVYQSYGRFHEAVERDAADDSGD